MLQRIYGTAWENAEQLAEHRRLKAEAARRDHRKIGADLNLFSIQPAAGGGLVFWHPKGAYMRTQMEQYWKDCHVEGGYDLLYTPHMASIDLWKTSGHFDFYKDDMFDQMEADDNEYQIKPMNCPFHVLTFKDSPKSYRDLPIRWAELGTVYRYERSGALNGLFRVRGFTQDDAHIFCLPDQLTDEILGVLDLTERILSKFGFTKYEVMLSTRPDKSVGSDEIWEKATAALEGALQRKGWQYGVDEGGGAFYGPKIDLKIKDAIGRTWQCSTIQADFNLPDRFGLEYTTADGDKAQPIMLHRAIFGSLERFFGVLIESTAGNFPLWIAPQQLRLLPVSDDFQPYCEEVRQLGLKAGLRVEVDPGGRSLSKQIKIANKDKIPLYAVVGQKEVDGRTLAVQARKEEGGLTDLGTTDVLDVLNRIELSAKSGARLLDIWGLEDGE
jgi:threonyl-tRNA synthetase